MPEGVKLIRAVSALGTMSGSLFCLNAVWVQILLWSTLPSVLIITGQWNTGTV